MTVTEESTRVDRAIRWLKDNRYVSPFIVAGICFIAVASAYNVVPDTMKTQLVSIFAARKINSGWIFLGYQDVNSRASWSEGPYATVLGDTRRDPTRPFRAGNVIVMNHDREVIITDYRTAGTKELYTAPPSVHGRLLDADHTGSVVKAGAQLLVRDVWIGHYPNADYAVWARVTPSTTAD